MTNNIAKSAITGVIGTSFMTLFSTLISEKKHRQFREQELLNELLKIFPLGKTNRLILAWIGHYMMGVTFNSINQNLLKKLKTSPTILNGLLLGAANGAIGIAIWKAIFELHPSPPKINLNRYLAHLMLAHLVFATLSNISMKKAETKAEPHLVTV